MSIEKYSQFISVHEQKTRTIGLRSLDEAVDVSSDYEDGHGDVNVTLRSGNQVKKIKSSHYYNEDPGEEDNYNSKDRKDYHSYLKTKHNLSDHEAKAVSGHFDKIYRGDYAKNNG